MINNHKNNTDHRTDFIALPWRFFNYVPNKTNLLNQYSYGKGLLKLVRVSFAKQAISNA